MLRSTGQSMEPSAGRRRAGVTLIEMLVVIAIIAVLMGLLLSAVGRVATVKERTKTQTQMNAIKNAITTVKDTPGYRLKYVPAGQLVIINPNTNQYTWTYFRLRNFYPIAGTAQPGEPDIDSFEARYIAEVFGVRPEGGNLGDPTPVSASDPRPIGLGSPGLSADLDANQTLTFFLTGMPESNGSTTNFTGFAKDPRYPFRARLSSDEPRNGLILDINGSKNYSTSGGFARLVDAWGNPFAYYTSFNGQTNKYYGGFNPGGPVNGPFYTTSNGKTQYENADGFQLISAGRDEKFGPGGLWQNISGVGEDDLANFSPNALGGGKQ